MKSKILYAFMFISIHFLCLGSVVHAFQLAVSASQTTVTVKSTVDFTCTPIGGTPPYTYSWNFDDVDSYKTTTISSNPSHTFRWAGTHYVEVTVTDSSSNEEKSVLLIDVLLSSATPTVNAVTDCGCDNTDSSDNTSRLAACIANNYDPTHGLQIEFPTGTYRFDEQTATVQAKTRAYGILLNGRKKVALVGTGSSRPILQFNNDRNTGATWDAFIMENFTTTSSDTYLLIKDLILEATHDPDYYSVPQCLIGNVDVFERRTYVTIEECDIRNFCNIGSYSRTIHRRNNMSQGGDYGSGNVEWIRYIHEGLAVRNYFSNGDDGHSHFFYCSSGSSDYFIVNNFANGSNMAPSKWFAQLKSDTHNYKVMGNLVKNITSGLVTTGAYDKQAYNASITNNRLISASSGIAIDSSSADILVEDNFFQDIAYNILSTGHNHWENPCNSAAGIAYQLNVAGDSAPGSSYSMHKDNLLGCEYCQSEVDSPNKNTDDETITKSADPSGWQNQDGYINPGPWEYTPPSNCTIVINGAEPDVTLTLSATDSGSGMGSDARFPFKHGALMQFSNDGVTWSEVMPYGESTTWILAEGTKTVYARFRDRDGNWSQPVFTAPGNFRIVSN